MPGPFDPGFLDALESACRGPWKGTAWRCVIGPTDPLRLNSRGGRWNPPDVEVLYCSLSETGAELELSAVIARQPIPITKQLTSYRLKAHLTLVCDVQTGSSELEAVGITRAALANDVWGLPQRIGEAADWLGVGGLVVPSARHEDGNLVIFANNLDRDDFYEIAGTADE